MLLFNIILCYNVNKLANMRWINMDNIQFTKEYISDRIKEIGADEFKQVCMDFTNICSKSELLEAAKQIGVSVKKGQGKGVYWITKE